MPAQHDLLAEPRAFVAGLRAARALAVGGEPSAGPETGCGDLLTAVEGPASRRSVWQIAGDIHGVDADAVADWDPDSDVRAQVRRPVKRARFLMTGGYLELAAGQRPRM